MSPVTPALLASPLVWRALLALALAGTLSSTIFLGMVLAAAWRYSRRSQAARKGVGSTDVSLLPPVTILKPLHGMEPRLRENLETFFQQDYPDYEIIFGAREAENPAVRVAQELCRRYPGRKAKIVFSGPPTWPNAKVFSLHKMIAASANDYLVISDSDVQVGNDLLRNIIPALLDPQIGLVTCPYRGIPAANFWSTLEALGMSVEMPSGVMVADMLEGMRFALGPVMATRRDVLKKIGGIAATADYYSDDFVLGNEVWAAGYRVIWSHYVAEHVLIFRSFGQTFSTQLRWMKSTRYSRPLGHLGTGMTFAMPFGVLGLIAAAALGYTGLGIALLGAAFLNRVIQSLTVGWGVLRDRRALRFCWLYPLRDLLGFSTWIGSYAGRSFFWRGEDYLFTKGGKIIPRQRPAGRAVANRPLPAPRSTKE